VLLTGFGPFPGVTWNATAHLVPELAAAAQRLFPDVRIACEVLPTEWAVAARRGAELLADIEPDVVVHFGVSCRARGFTIEARARNVCEQVPDAAGAFPGATALVEGGAETLFVNLSVQHLVSRLRSRGFPAFVSRDAGTYLCNALLYRSLSWAEAGGRPCRAGFVHLPASLCRPGMQRGRSSSPLTWTQALEGGLEIIAGCLGRTLTTPAALVTTTFGVRRAPSLTRPKGGFRPP
jgi:pyroglutamyl-peptidase